MIEISLAAYIAADSRYTALCSAAPYPLILPAASPALPALTYQTISATPDSTVDGPSGLQEIRLQFDAWGSTYSAAKTLQDTVRQIIDGYSGTLPDGTVVFNVMQDDDADLYEQDSRLYRARTDYKVQFAQ